MEANKMSLIEQCQEIARKQRGMVSTALATLMFACQMNVAAQTTTPVSPAVSAIAPSAKDLGILTIASNGDKFDEFLQKYGDKAIDEAEKLVDNNKWTEKDYDAFVKYQDKKDVVALVSKQKEGKNLDNALINIQLNTLDEFIKLYNSGNTRGEGYILLKEGFKKIILSGKPPEVINKINSITGLKNAIIA